MVLCFICVLFCSLKLCFFLNIFKFLNFFLIIYTVYFELLLRVFYLLFSPDIIQFTLFTYLYQYFLIFFILFQIIITFFSVFKHQIRFSFTKDVQLHLLKLLGAFKTWKQNHKIYCRPLGDYIMCKTLKKISYKVLQLHK